ncbi:ROK family transcriptional regulator [Cohnella soli]|uniref:ROK family transcriptional regulator n=1 Tax=Cohnella soli TaxID=425005 RepID=A0ABW0HQ75_9BACL
MSSKGNKGINHKQIKVTNQTLIINEVRKSDGLSRSDLARALRLSAPSISTNIDELISREIILEKGIGSAAFGRKPIHIEFNNEYGYVVAVDMSGGAFRIALSDLSGTNILEYGLISDVVQITSEVIERTMNTIAEMLARRKIPPHKLLCICIGSPGFIEPSTGSVVYAPRIVGFTGTSLRDTFAERFNTLVLIKNDMNCAAVGEHLFGTGQHYYSFINILIDVGIGSGLILNEKLYEGARGSAGEIGLWVNDTQEAVRQNKVTLNNMLDYQVSVFGLICQVREAKPDLFISLGQGEVNLHLVPEYAQIMFNAARAGDEQVISIIREAAIRLGCVLKNLYELLDLEAIIIGGLILEIEDIFMPPLEQFLNDNVSGKVKVLTSSLGDKGVIYGAIGQGINHVLVDIINRIA